MFEKNFEKFFQKICFAKKSFYLDVFFIKCEPKILSYPLDLKLSVNTHIFSKYSKYWILRASFLSL